MPETLTRARRNQIDAIIDLLDYDFATFEIEHFCQHIERLHQRPIIVTHWRLAPDLFGMWFAGAQRDYIFINASLHPIHQTHTLLHELAHLFLKHRGIGLDEVNLDPELAEALRQLLTPAPTTGHFRSAQRVLLETPEEVEAELFVILIQKRVLHAQRMNELYGPEVTSIESMRPYVNALNFNS